MLNFRKLLKEIILKKYILFFLLFINISSANLLLDKFIQEQTSKLDYVSLDINSTDNNENSILDKRYTQYGSFLNTLLQARETNLNTIELDTKKIFYLKRKIELNKRHQNNYAVLRDEINLHHLEAQDTLKRMLLILISSTFEKTEKAYSKNLKDALVANHNYIEGLNLSFEKRLESADTSNSIIIEAKENLAQLNALIFLNNDLRQYINVYQSSVYQSSLYASFGFNRFAKDIQDSQIAKKIDPLLESIHINTSKLLLIFTIMFITFSASGIFYWIVNIILDKWDYKVTEIQFILNNVRNIIRTIILLFGLELIINIFLGIGEQASENNKFFSMSYVILLTYLSYKVANTIAIIKIQSIEKRAKDYRNEVINLGIKALNFFIFLIGLLIVLKVYGVNLTAILSGLGIGSLALAFAAKDTLSNFFGSISILLDNPFSQGDLIEVDGNIGTVIEIGLRSTTIRTFENAMITIPNLTLANSPVENWSKRTLGRRIKMHVGVTYESDFNNIRSAISDIYEMLLTHPKVASNKTSYNDSKKELKLISKEDHIGVKRLLNVRLDNFSASSIDILVYCFSKTTDWEDWLEVKEDVMYKIASILEKNSLSFAYPALAIHMQEPTKED